MCCLQLVPSYSKHANMKEKALSNKANIALGSFMCCKILLKGKPPQFNQNTGRACCGVPIFRRAHEGGRMIEKWTELNTEKSYKKTCLTY